MVVGPASSVHLQSPAPREVGEGRAGLTALKPCPSPSRPWLSLQGSRNFSPLPHSLHPTHWPVLSPKYSPGPALCPIPLKPLPHSACPEENQVLCISTAHRIKSSWPGPEALCCPAGSPLPSPSSLTLPELWVSLRSSLTPSFCCCKPGILNTEHSLRREPDLCSCSRHSRTQPRLCFFHHTLLL